MKACRSTTRCSALTSSGISLTTPLPRGSHEIPGTHAAGVAAGRFSEVERFSGVAPDARILPVRFSNGTGPQALDLAHAIEYAVEMGACIINVSPAGESPNRRVRRAIQYAAARNVLVVCSAPDASSPMALADEDRVPNQINVLSIGEQWQPLGELRAPVRAPGRARICARAAMARQRPQHAARQRASARRT